MAISNYHPSKAWYPLEDYFSDVPDDIIQCPNAEHWRFKWNGVLTNNSNIHLNGIGSLYQSDTDEIWGSGKEISGEVEAILDDLIYTDGGGITINHPSWSNWYLDRHSLPLDRILTLLDMDERVLGIEFYNQTSQNYDVGWDLDTWDAVLMTGRRAWGFAVPDHYHETHAVWQGRNVLLVPENTEQACLRAYRNGEFFAQLKNSQLSFTNISVNGNILKVSTNNATSITAVIDGKRTTYEGPSAEVPFSYLFTYIRVEATDGDDTIYSNPIINNDEKYNNSTAKSLLLL